MTVINSYHSSVIIKAIIVAIVVAIVVAIIVAIVTVIIIIRVPIIIGGFFFVINGISIVIAII